MAYSVGGSFPLNTKPGIFFWRETAAATNKHVIYYYYYYSGSWSSRSGTRKAKISIFEVFFQLGGFLFSLCVMAHKGGGDKTLIKHGMALGMKGKGIFSGRFLYPWSWRIAYKRWESMGWNLEWKGGGYSQDGFCITKLMGCEVSDFRWLRLMKVSTDWMVSFVSECKHWKAGLRVCTIDYTQWR